MCAINWTNGSPAKRYARRKQIDVKHHYVKDVMDKGSVINEATTTFHIQASLLTKTPGTHVNRLTIHTIDLFVPDNQLPERC